MLFNSLEFLLFFPAVTILYFVFPGTWRILLLLAASCLFYMAFVPAYILILAFTIVIDYIAGIAIAGAQGQRRRLYLLVSLAANIGVLAVFKYYSFANDNLSWILSQRGAHNYLPALGLILPIGLSFHTFQAMSYTIEVYRGHFPAERNFATYALYVMFYPQLVAGPIERPQNLLPQFHSRHAFDYERFASGLRLMGWGFFKKLVIADRLALVVNQVYNHSDQYSGGALIVATYFFSFQIYCDFSGYSDIARGAARVMGINLMLNFDRPYTARSIGEFWRRWHISLSTWFRDYLYVPMGGSRVRDLLRYRNLIVVFLVSGLWHGANWTFVIWGAIHGLILIATDATRTLRGGLAGRLGFKLPAMAVSWAQMLITFHIVAFAWIFFRAKDFADATYIVGHLFDFSAGWSQFSRLGLGAFDLALAFGAIPVLLVLEALGAAATAPNRPASRWSGPYPAAVRWGAYYAMLVTILLLGKFSREQFIYFQF